MWRPPRLDDRTIAVTGASSGIGLWIALHLARAGAEVVLLCRDTARGERAATALREEVPGARTRVVRVDTSDLSSAHEAGATLGRLPRLDALINNAGLVIAPAHRQVSVDGHELTLATNALGHLALTHGALGALERAGGRCVWMGSMSAKLVRPTPDDLELERSYAGWRAYAQSKLVAQALGFELQRRLAERASTATGLVAHPGYSLPVLAPQAGPVFTPPTPTTLDLLQFPWAQGNDRGALPAVYAATSPHARGGQFYGPRNGLRGDPVVTGGIAGVAGAGHTGMGGPGWRSVDPVVGAAVWRFAARACGLPD
ncbi:SDR family NAD(P)-dependent oxidoreductase [Nocardiopsis sp. MG754419]|uniref:SDR family NAD(P)-dependent oxidoreductase n=1 Tax=Nocardiopsis sp. MG754419 TaxID=2259865 RepID=UPI001BA9BEA6|nr:SDR family NAD(P)-dependent oxidoreductase [Nocardiopsis sp. MG754419]MBR8743968.1 hypothetical protein [Nocardiopsis sp. MG754419]